MRISLVLWGRTQTKGLRLCGHYGPSYLRSSHGTGLELGKEGRSTYSLLYLIISIIRTI
jgi:hypothetical protein